MRSPLLLPETSNQIGQERVIMAVRSSVIRCCNTSTMILHWNQSIRREFTNFAKILRISLFKGERSGCDKLVMNQQPLLGSALRPSIIGEDIFTYFINGPAVFTCINYQYLDLQDVHVAFFSFLIFFLQTITFKLVFQGMIYIFNCWCRTCHGKDVILSRKIDASDPLDPKYCFRR